MVLNNSKQVSIFPFTVPYADLALAEPMMEMSFFCLFLVCWVEVFLKIGGAQRALLSINVLFEGYQENYLITRTSMIQLPVTPSRYSVLHF